MVKKGLHSRFLVIKKVTWDQIRRTFPNLRRQKISDRMEKQIKINSFYKRYSERQQNEIEELKKKDFWKFTKT